VGSLLLSILPFPYLHSEPRRCSRRHSAGHTTTKQHVGVTQRTRSAPSRQSSQNTRPRMHALGTSPRRASRNPTSSAGSRQQLRPNRTPQKDRKLAHQSPGAEGSGRTLSGRTQKVLQETLPRVTQNQTAHRSPPQNTEHREQKTVASDDDDCFYYFQK